MLTIIRYLLAVVLIIVLAMGTLWARSYWPEDTENVSVQCSPGASPWSLETSLKVMSYNVQYMASKNYVFFYDIDLDNAERVEAVAKANKTIASRPSESDVFWTLDKVAEVIAREDPDVVLLQEISGADDSRTHYVDQTAELLRRLPTDRYPCMSATPYWKAEFILHPDVLGPVDMRLLTLSKYRMSKSVRHQLPRQQHNRVTAPFHFHRALLESHIATSNDQTVAVINTHYEAWAAGTDLMSKQVKKTLTLLKSLDAVDIPWVLGGDLNLLPPDNDQQRQKILATRTGVFDEITPIEALYDNYRGIPSTKALTSADAPSWYTHMPNDPTVTEPDRTIDYLFYSNQWSLQDARVIQEGTLDISDHLPVVGMYTIESLDR